MSNRICWLACFILHFVCLILKIEGHGRLTVPTPRDQLSSVPTYLQNAPVDCPNNNCDASFVCRDRASRTPAVTLNAGQTLNVQWEFEALHVGDCFLYLSYDTTKPDGEKEWFKIAEYFDCKSQSGRPVPTVIPAWVKSCDHCVLRWEWYALHIANTGVLEFYSQCVDVRIANPNGGSLGTPRFLIPGHLPSNPTAYRRPFDPQTPQFMVGPKIATPESGSTPQTTKSAVVSTTARRTTSQTTGQPAVSTTARRTTSQPISTTSQTTGQPAVSTTERRTTSQPVLSTTARRTTSQSNGVSTTSRASTTGNSINRQTTAQATTSEECVDDDDDNTVDDDQQAQPTTESRVAAPTSDESNIISASPRIQSQRSVLLVCIASYFLAVLARI